MGIKSNNMKTLFLNISLGMLFLLHFTYAQQNPNYEGMRKNVLYTESIGFSSVPISVNNGDQIRVSYSTFSKVNISIFDNYSGKITKAPIESVDLEESSYKYTFTKNDIVLIQIYTEGKGNKKYVNVELIPISNGLTNEVKYVGEFSYLLDKKGDGKVYVKRKHANPKKITRGLSYIETPSKLNEESLILESKMKINPKFKFGGKYWLDKDLDLANLNHKYVHLYKNDTITIELSYNGNMNEKEKLPNKSIVFRLDFGINNDIKYPSRTNIYTRGQDNYIVDFFTENSNLISRELEFTYEHKFDVVGYTYEKTGYDYYNEKNNSLNDWKFQKTFIIGAEGLYHLDFITGSEGIVFNSPLDVKIYRNSDTPYASNTNYDYIFSAYNNQTEIRQEPTVVLKDSYTKVAIKVDNSISSGLTAIEVLNAYINSIGGRKILENVKNISSTTKFDNYVVKSVQEAPNKMKSITVMDDGTVWAKIIRNGDEVIYESQGKEIKMDKKTKEYYLNNIKFFPELSFSEDGVESKLTGTSVIDGEKVYVVELKYPKNSVLSQANVEKSIEYYSIETALKIRTMNETKMMSQVIISTVDYKNYKEVNGVLYPFEQITEYGGQKIKTTLETVEINKELSIDTFKTK